MKGAGLSLLGKGRAIPLHRSHLGNRYAMGCTLQETNWRGQGEGILSGLSMTRFDLHHRPEAQNICGKGNSGMCDSEMHNPQLADVLPVVWIRAASLPLCFQQSNRSEHGCTSMDMMEKADTRKRVQ